MSSDGQPITENALPQSNPAAVPSAPLPTQPQPANTRPTLDASMLSTLRPTPLSQSSVPQAFQSSGLAMTMASFVSRLPQIPPSQGQVPLSASSLPTTDPRHQLMAISSSSSNQQVSSAASSSSSSLPQFLPPTSNTATSIQNAPRSLSSSSSLGSISARPLGPLHPRLMTAVTPPWSPTTLLQKRAGLGTFPPTSSHTTPNMQSSKDSETPALTSFSSNSQWSSSEHERRSGGRKRLLTGQERQAKGLSLFSRMVCEKVEAKRKTSYTEVSDELVHDFSLQGVQDDGKQIDEKNIRRRVYDALNVLIALDIIHKDRKQIVWRGLPGKNVEELDGLQAKKARLEKSIQQKREQLSSLVSSEISYRCLMHRNQNGEGGSHMHTEYKVHMPFIVVNTDPKTKIYCEMRSDKEKIFFNFNQPFEIHEDVEVLRWLKVAETHPLDINTHLDPRLLPFATSGSSSSTSPTQHHNTLSPGPGLVPLDLPQHHHQHHQQHQMQQLNNNDQHQHGSFMPTEHHHHHILLQHHQQQQHQHDTEDTNTDSSQPSPPA